MSKNEAVKTPKKEPTASEALFFFAIVKHMRNKAEIDWDAVANEQGFKNAEVAKVRFGQVKRKLGISATESPGSSARAPKSASTAKKRGAAAALGPETPTKVKKTPARGGAKGRGRARVKKEEPAAESDDQDECKGEDDEETVKTEALYEEQQFQDDFKAMINEGDPF